MSFIFFSAIGSQCDCSSSPMPWLSSFNRHKQWRNTELCTLCYWKNEQAGESSILLWFGPNSECHSPGQYNTKLFMLEGNVMLLIRSTEQKSFLKDQI